MLLNKNTTPKQGLYPDTQILDIRDIDIANSKILPSDIPVFVISLRVQRNSNL